MKFVKRIIWVSVFSILLGCGVSKQSDNEDQISSKIDETPSDDSTVISFHEVYKLADEKLLQVVESIPEIEGFTPIYALNYQYYPHTVIGVTNESEYKNRIVGELMKLDSLPENSFFCWSKGRQENRVTTEAFYHLYLLKDLEKESEIVNEEISKATVELNEFSNELEIRIMFNESGREKWGKMTEKAARNRDYIAIVIDDEVYSCPFVMDPIYSGESSISGFGNRAEAEKIVERINN